jgi:hypothetical protein
LFSPIGDDWHIGTRLTINNWVCDLMSEPLSMGQPIDIGSDIPCDPEVIYWCVPIHTYLIHVGDILITCPEVKRFEALCHDPNDSPPGVATEEPKPKVTQKEVFTRLKSEGSDESEIAKELKKQFPTITLLAMGRLLEPPSAKERSVGALRKIAQRALRK